MESGPFFAVIVEYFYRRAACTQATVRGNGVKAQGVKLLSPDNAKTEVVVPEARKVPAAIRRP